MVSEQASSKIEPYYVHFAGMCPIKLFLQAFVATIKSEHELESYVSILCMFLLSKDQALVLELKRNSFNLALNY